MNGEAERARGGIAGTVAALGGEAATLWGELAGLRRERRAARPRPPASGLVVDIGAGHLPHPRADVIVDKYVEDDFERGFALATAKPLIVADGQALPFADASLAYVITSHVLEHATDPELFAAELSRVGLAGFVQVPTRLAELGFGWAFHPWLIDRDDELLVFSPNPGSRPLGTALHDMHGSSALFRLTFFAHRSSWHHTMHWQGRLRVSVSGHGEARETAGLDLERTLAGLERVPRPPLPSAVVEALRCPACRLRLSPQAGAVQCSGCGRAFPMAGGVPVLLLEAALTGVATSS